MKSGLLETVGLNVLAGEKILLRNINARIEPKQVFGIIGPSGAGKSTLLRCLNRLIELDPGLRTEGDIRLDGASIYSSVDIDDLRSRIGIIFQQPVVFPLSIYKNVLFGVRHLGRHPRSEWPQIAEESLRQAALWEEVKDRLDDSALKLSVGQQQRLCLARTLAVEPEVILMDEPTGSLDPAAAELIEDLILRLKKERTIVLVTHHFGQAGRVADVVARIALRNGAGEIVCVGKPSEVASMVMP